MPRYVLRPVREALALREQLRKEPNKSEDGDTQRKVWEDECQKFLEHVAKQEAAEKGPPSFFSA